MKKCQIPGERGGVLSGSNKEDVKSTRPGPFQAFARKETRAAGVDATQNNQINAADMVLPFVPPTGGQISNIWETFRGGEEASETAV